MCLSGCKHGKPGGTTQEDLRRTLTTEQCIPEFAFDDDGKILTDRSVCWCRDYKFSLARNGAVSRYEAMPIGYCHEMVGYTKYDQVSSFNEEVRLLIRKGIGI